MREDATHCPHGTRLPDHCNACDQEAMAYYEERDRQMIGGDADLRRVNELANLAASAHAQRVEDGRVDALRVMRDVQERLEMEAGSNTVMRGLIMDVLREVAAAVQRLEQRCPDLLGPEVGRGSECQCWRCSFCDEVDPFEEGG